MQVKTEGTVNLSISELDNLRGQIVQLAKEKDALAETQGRVLVEVTVAEKYSSYESKRTDYNGYIRNRPANRYLDTYETVLRDEYRIIDKKETYVNLEKIEKNIYEDARHAVIEEIGGLQGQIEALQRSIHNAKTNQVKEINDLKEKQKEQIEILQKSKEKEINTLQKKIDELEGKEVDRTKDEIIQKLHKEVEEMKQEIEKTKLKKGFWGFLH